MVYKSKSAEGKGLARSISVRLLAGFVVSIFLAGCITTEIDDRPRAGSYGITDPLMAALVVRDDSTGFEIRSVYLKGIDTTDEYHWGGISNDQEQAYEIEPGNYNLYIGYYDASGMFECSGSAVAEVSVEAEMAVGFSLTGGSIGGCSVMYEPPKSVNISSALIKPASPKITKNINWPATLCLIVPIVILVGGFLGFLALRKRSSAPKDIQPRT